MRFDIPHDHAHQLHARTCGRTHHGGCPGIAVSGISPAAVGVAAMRPQSSMAARRAAIPADEKRHGAVRSRSFWAGTHQDRRVRVWCPCHRVAAHESCGPGPATAVAGYPTHFGGYPQSGTRLRRRYHRRTRVRVGSRGSTLTGAIPRPIVYTPQTRSGRSGPQSPRTLPSGYPRMGRQSQAPVDRRWCSVAGPAAATPVAGPGPQSPRALPCDRSRRPWFSRRGCAAAGPRRLQSQVPVHRSWCSVAVTMAKGTVSP